MPQVKTMNPIQGPAALTKAQKLMVPGPTIRPKEGKIWPRGNPK